MEWILSSIERFIDRTGRFIALCIVPMVVSVSLEIIVRSAVGSPLMWTFETSLFLYGGYTMLLGGYAYLKDSHVRVDVFYSRAFPRTRAILDIVTFPFFLLYAGIVLWLGIGFAAEAWHYNERSQTLWGPILFPIKMTIPIGALLVLIAGIVKFIRNCQQLRSSSIGKSNK